MVSLQCHFDCEIVKRNVWYRALTQYRNIKDGYARGGGGGGKGMNAPCEYYFFAEFLNLLKLQLFFLSESSQHAVSVFQLFICICSSQKPCRHLKIKLSDHKTVLCAVSKADILVLSLFAKGHFNLRSYHVKFFRLSKDVRVSTLRMKEGGGRIRTCYCLRRVVRN